MYFQWAARNPEKNSTMTSETEFTILGGGPAGLAMGFYARSSGLKFRIFEAQNRVGGNCITLQCGDFRFDSGAHRFHDKDPKVTAEIKQLLGHDLRKIEVPSQIWHAGRFYDFPIAPLNLMHTLGPVAFVKAALSLLQGRLARNATNGSFEDFAVHAYGADIASRFLLNYSEKLWGAPCSRLSPAICGARLKGLGLASFLIEARLGRRARTRHLDGAFYYPRQGYGAIVENLAEACGRDMIQLESRVSRIFHAGDRITAIEINDQEYLPVNDLACTLPLGLVLRLLDPEVPSEVRDAARMLRFRNVILVALFLAKDRITNNGSIYFPDASIPFTRVYEPKNRSEEMAPPGYTSLVAEIPCQTEDAIWNTNEETLSEMVADHFVRLGWIAPGDIVGRTTYRIHHAYPILELDYEARLSPVLEYLSGFRNLHVAGRNGCFVYSHLHDMMGAGRRVVEEVIARRAGEPNYSESPSGEFAVSG